MDSDEVLPFPKARRPVTQVRSTLLLASVQSLRESGRFDEWAAKLAPQTRDVIVAAPAGVWLPIEVAVMHYEAVDALTMTAEEMSALGQAVFGRLRGTLLGTMVDLARDAGVTPWTLYRQLQRYWNRAFDGGSVRVLALGPKEARLDLEDCPLLDIGYYRGSFRGHITGMTQLFCKKVYVRELIEPRLPAPGSVVFRAQWV